MYGADSLTTQYITDPIAVNSSPWFEWKEPEIGNAYSLQVKKSREVRCWETANKSFDKDLDVLRFRSSF